MPTLIPVTSGTTLSKYRHRAVLVRCSECNHSRDIRAEALARLIGWDVPLRQSRTRFRCSACGKHRVELFIR